ncbi:ROK family protein [Phyllobacterium sp. SB3]|uniref:ROK family protein n=1 Tax=Phyllobacterium sp. SB3 TaxID=3156073 RepID=UPI0032AFDD01
MEECYSLGFDLGGTQVRAALAGKNSIIRRAAGATDIAGGPEGVVLQLSQLAKEVAPGIDFTAIKAVGIAAPGPLDTVSGIVDHIPTLPGWEQFPLKQRLSDLFNLPAIVENDGIAAAYGEWKQGAGRGLDNLVFVTVSTGIGGGVVMDGRLLHGRRGLAAHVGHFRMAAAGPVCSCGRTGCFEAFAAGTALGKRASEIALGNTAGFLGKKALTEKIQSRHVVAGAREMDPECIALLKDEAWYLGVGFTNLIHLFSPERVIMGGGVSQAFDLLKDEIHAVIQKEAMGPFKQVEVVAAELGDNAGLFGVASLAMAKADSRAGGTG